MKIKGIERNSVYEIVINKSKFFAYSFAVNNTDDVDFYLSFLSKSHTDATHICYAYSIYPIQEKSFDDAEPQGTAGKPILDCIKKSGYQNVLVAIVRYFGGVKLGAGGLVRAYSGGASNVLKLSGVKIAEKCYKINFHLNLNENKKLPLLQSLDLKMFDYTFGEIIDVFAYCKVDEIESIKEQIKNILARDIDFIVDETDYFL